MDRDRLDSLLAYVQTDHRVCPLPLLWKELWEMLPGKRRVGAGWHPPLPLILGAWGETSSVTKRKRMINHINYAAEHGVLEDVDKFLRSLTPDQWHHEK